MRSEQSFLAGLMCLVGIVSFVLGQYSVTATSAPKVELQNQAGVVFTDVAEPIADLAGIPVVASSGGTKYHLLTCPGASSIKETNKIYFDSVELAQAAGYSAARNCEF